MPHPETGKSPFITHEIENQPPILTNTPLYETNFPLVEGLAREGAGWAEDDVSEYGRIMGSAEVRQLGEIRQAAGASKTLDCWTADLDRELADGENLERRARIIVERLALALQASLLVRNAPAAVADAFCASRLSGGVGGAFGTLPNGTDSRAILKRATPAVD